MCFQLVPLRPSGQNINECMFNFIAWVQHATVMMQLKMITNYKSITFTEVVSVADLSESAIHFNSSAEQLRIYFFNSLIFCC